MNTTELQNKIQKTSEIFEKTHLYECQCVECLSMIAGKIEIPNRRIITLFRYTGALAEKFTVSQTARKRKSWIEMEAKN